MGILLTQPTQARAPPTAVSPQGQMRAHWLSESMHTPSSQSAYCVPCAWGKATCSIPTQPRR